MLKKSTLFLPPFHFQHRMTSFFQVRKQLVSAKGDYLSLAIPNPKFGNNIEL
jgi:hypothetical protein